MKALLDTNIVIHREGAKGINQGIGELYRWLDNLGWVKCVHQVTVAELNKLHPGETKVAISIKIAAYNVLKTIAPLSEVVSQVADRIDTTVNDANDTLLLNELFNDRVDILITEDKKIARKAELLSIGHRVFNIDSFLEKVTAENPALVDYKILSVRKKLFGEIELSQHFFDSFRRDYPGFDHWFNRKSEEEAYVCYADGDINAFLYIKREDETESYVDIEPTFLKMKRLKIGTFKVVFNGYKLGERFLKIVFDNAVRFNVDEVYVTTFAKGAEQARLVQLLDQFGFVHHGLKNNAFGNEDVLKRSMVGVADLGNPKVTYPYASASSRVFLCPIRPEYHTSLLPDSILNNESASDFVEHEPFRNAISKVYISRSYVRDLRSGDVILFYRTGGYHKSVVTTVGVVESAVTDILNESDFLRLCRRRSVFSDQELLLHWNQSGPKPFIVNFLYTYSLPKRLNLARLIELGIIAGVDSAPRGFTQITNEQFRTILEDSNSDDRYFVD